MAQTPPSSTYRAKRAPIVKPDYNSPTPPYQILPLSHPQHRPPTKKKQTRLPRSCPSPSKFLLPSTPNPAPHPGTQTPSPAYRQAHSAPSAPPSSPGNPPSPTASRNLCARNKVFRIRTSDLQRRIQAKGGSTAQPTPRTPHSPSSPALPAGTPCMKLKSTSFTDGTWGRVSHAICRSPFREARAGAEVTLLGGLIFSWFWNSPIFCWPDNSPRGASCGVDYVRVR